MGVVASARLRVISICGCKNGQVCSRLIGGITQGAAHIQLESLFAHGRKHLDVYPPISFNLAIFPDNRRTFRVLVGNV